MQIESRKIYGKRYFIKKHDCAKNAGFNNIDMYFNPQHRLEVEIKFDDRKYSITLSTEETKKIVKRLFIDCADRVKGYLKELSP